MKLTKIMSIIMVIAMLLSFATVAFADADGSITIKKAVSGQSYSIYKMFDLSKSGNGSSASYSYTIASSSPWYEFFSNGEGSNYVAIDKAGSVSWKTGASEANLAAAALEFAAKNTTTVNAAETKTASAATVEFSGLEYGYYLVDSSLGALCSLTTAEPNADIDEKNSVPSIDKEVYEDSTEEWGIVNDAEIGETVNYRATIGNGTGAVSLVMHDTMTSGLTFNQDSVAITLNGQEVAKANYTVKTTGITDGCTFEIAFDTTYVKALEANSSLVVTYSAKVNENAVIRLDGNKNSVKLVYGESNSVLTGPTTTTYVWDFNIFKHDGDNAALAGATFALYTDKDCTNEMKFAANGTAVLTTTASGKITLVGLDSGVYYLKETAAPAGYNLLVDPIKVTIDAEGNVYAKDDTTALTNNQVNVLNQSGDLLPETGGIGTQLFYILGGVLILAAIVLLVSKKRMSQSC